MSGRKKRNFTHDPDSISALLSTLTDTARQLTSAAVVAFLLISLGCLLASLNKRLSARLHMLESSGASWLPFYLFWAAFCGLARLVWTDFAHIPWRSRHALTSRRDVLLVAGVVLALLLLYQDALFRLLSGSVHAPPSALLFFSGSLLGPFVEEWLFRGLTHAVLLARAPRLGVAGAIVLGSLIFGFWHMSFEGHSAGFVRNAFMHSYFGGLVALLRWRLDGLLPGCIVHVLANSLILLTS